MTTIKRFAIGDVQGCCDDLDRLLSLLDKNNPKHHFWFTGDLINRGPDSAQTIRTIMSLGARAKTVLGNHDLHFLAMASGFRNPGKKDTAAQILDAPDAAQIIDWLRQQPLLHLDEQFALCHAGIYPSWSGSDAARYAAEVSDRLKSDQWQSAVSEMYGNVPAAWSEQLNGAQRLRFIVNSFTRMRYLQPDGSLDLLTKEGRLSKEGSLSKEGRLSKEDRLSEKSSDPPSLETAHLTPWFDWPNRAIKQTIVFGHWSTQGLVNRPHTIGLDTGCIWGGSLTAMDIDTRQITSVPCKTHQLIGG